MHSKYVQPGMHPEGAMSLPAGTSNGASDAAKQNIVLHAATRTQPVGSCLKFGDSVFGLEVSRCHFCRYHFSYHRCPCYSLRVPALCGRGIDPVHKLGCPSYRILASQCTAYAPRPRCEQRCLAGTSDFPQMRRVHTVAGPVPTPSPVPNSSPRAEECDRGQRRRSRLLGKLQLI
ncbi:hypothetical protein PLICRDRAFT_630982 [Plicaturopsis crispa FD-325 SS-3]|nr:hypothetical protein PLICRDRAFT_630982 [Plicaturopsis crispa FD-325 SS-3]